MLIKSLKLNNIRSYINEEIIFPEGSILLSGDIGAGKSTILLAIEFALFGIMRSDLSGNSLLRNGKNFGSVELNFKVEDKDIIIKRTLKRTKEGVRQDTGVIFVNGSAIDLTAQDLKSRVLELLGYPSDMLSSAKSLIFRYTVYTPQEEMKKIIFEDEKERLNTLRRVFGIDKYKRIIENSDIIIKKIGEEVRILNEKIIDLPDKIKHKEEVESQLSNQKKEREKILNLYQLQKKELENKKNEIAILEKETERYNDLKKQILVLKTKIEEKEMQERRFLSEIEKIKKEIKEEEQNLNLYKELLTENIEKAIEEEEKEYIKKNNQEVSLKSKIMEIERRIKEINDEIKSFEKKIYEIKERKEKISNLKKIIIIKDSLRLQIDNLKNSIESVKEKISTLEALRKSATEIKNNIHTMEKCPVCSHLLLAEDKLRIEKEYENKIKEFNNNLSELLKTKEDISKEICSYEKKIEDIFVTEKEIERLEGALSDASNIEDGFRKKQETVAELKKQRLELQEEIKNLNIEDIRASLSKKKEISNKLKEMEFIRKNLSEKKQKVQENERLIKELIEEKTKIINEKNKLSEEISKIENCEKELIKSKNEFEKIRDELLSVEIQKSTIEKDIQTYEKTLKELSEEVNAKMLTKNKIEKLKEKQEWIKEKLIPLAKLIESHIMQTVYEEFESHFKKWASLLIEDESINIKLDENFSPVVEQNGYPIDISFLSGGEKTSCALAYRLALNKVINDIMSSIKTKDILILDEPTDGFSSEQLDKVRDVLEQINLKQMIIVSHEAKLESFVDNIIRISKTHHISKVIE
ncbi:MAG: SMC family ATPase [Candidatus Woesearchaeota archaeon]